jgi:hypothetical protein
MATSVQNQGHLRLRHVIAFSSPRLMADSQLDSTGSAKSDRSSIVRFVLWATVAIVLVVGLVLFFRYTRLMTPLL